MSPSWGLSLLRRGRRPDFRLQPLPYARRLAVVLFLRQEGARKDHGVQLGMGSACPAGDPYAVTIMQAVLRNLVFSLEIAKVKEIPAEGGAVLYLDSFDQVRMVDNTLRAVEEGVASPEHEKFRAACHRERTPS